MIYIGYDPREDIAYEVCKFSIESRSVIDTRKLYSKDIDLYTRSGDRQSTDFTFTRFWVPYLSRYTGYSIFVDCDFLFLADPEELIDIAIADQSKAVWCAQHPRYIPNSHKKMDSMTQNSYYRKNWASLMVFNNAHPDCKQLRPEYLNNHKPGLDFHQFNWTENIGSLSLDWNCLDDYYLLDNPKAIHYTDGGPWFDGYENTMYSDKWTEEYQKMKIDID